MTNRLIRYLSPFVLLAFPALAADQVVLTNGDTITGAIVKKEGATLTIKSEFLGVVTMPWSAVKSVHSDTELNVVLPAGQTAKGKLSTTGDQLQIASLERLEAFGFTTHGIDAGLKVEYLIVAGIV